MRKVKPVNYYEACELVMKYHYSKVLPRLTKFVLGLYEEDALVGVLTLGWGTRPEHTISKIFPSLHTKDYFEIGKMCLSDACERNSESWFLSQCIKWLKKYRPDIKLLYTWADGIIGKPGFVYQAANFFFGGHIWTEIYLNNEGIKVHARTMQGLSSVKGSGRFNSRAYEVTKDMGFTKYFGMQIRYCYPLCNEKEWKRLQVESSVEWKRKDYPKDDYLRWEKQIALGERIPCGLPPFTGGNYIPKEKVQDGLF